jgi:hypothetical protein
MSWIATNYLLAILADSDYIKTIEGKNDLIDLVFL